MIHLGDITKIHGDEIPAVDCITGGSPCQDLSVAGKRAGLDGERSGLFMEQIRIVREMRKRDRDQGRTGWMVRPRYMVWENVPGAFSSNGGKDFQAVITEIVRVVEPQCPDVPMPDKGGWSKSGCLYGEMGDWSIAWRVHDAQFWGVPQRRKRIALVADFGGMSAPEILFERQGLSGDLEPGGAAREETAGSVGNGTESAMSFQERAGKPGGARESSCRMSEPEPCQPLTTSQSSTGCFNPWDAQSARVYPSDGSWHSLNANESGGQSRDAVLASNGCLNPWDVQSKHITSPDGVAEPLYSGECRYGGGESYTLTEPVPIEGNGQRESHRGDGYGSNGDPCFTLNGTEHHAVAYGISSYESNAMKSANPHSGVYEADTSRTLDNNGGNPACNQGGMAIVTAVDVRNGKENECVNGTLQSKPNGGTSLNLNNVVRVESQ